MTGSQARADGSSGSGTAGNVVLIGMRASGKTTLGRLLACQLGMDFVDTDDELGRRTGRSPDEVLASEGEPDYRRRESEVLVWAASLRGTVVATGGGAPLLDAFAPLAGTGLVLYLDQDVDTLLARQRARPRPPLTDLPLREEIRSVLSLRGPRYRELADIVVPAALGGPILAALRELPDP